MLKSKFIVIFFIIIILLNIFSGHASAFGVVYNDVGYDFGDLKLFNYTVVYLYNSDCFRICSLEDEPVYTTDREGKKMIICSGNYYFYTYNFKTSSFVDFDETVRNQSYFGILQKGADTFVYSTFDVKDDDGKVVFQEPALTLGGMLAITNPVKKFQITMSGTIVFLMVFLVSLVGFLKAWSILSNSLRKA